MKSRKKNIHDPHLFRHCRNSRQGRRCAGDARFRFASGICSGQGACAWRTAHAKRWPSDRIDWKDTRISGYMLEAALEAGFSAAGVDVTLAGPIPTPGVAYLTRTLRLSAGVVISASHNPYDDNGIKFFSADGNKLPDEVERAIETQLQRALDCAPSRQLGKARRLDDAAGRYIEF